MYRAMVGVGLGCGLLIVAVYQGTGPVIARNRAEALERAIFQVLPEARSSHTFDLDGERVHAGYGEDGRLVGFAVEAAGMGYQDVIEVLYGYDFAAEAIIGIRVLSSRETPGLGDKIETDPAFLANFERLDARLAPDGASLAHPIEAVKKGQKQHPWQVDGITGATISSEAIANILRRSASEWVPRLQASLDDYREVP